MRKAQPSFHRITFPIHLFYDTPESHDETPSAHYILLFHACLKSNCSLTTLGETVMSHNSALTSVQQHARLICLLVLADCVSYTLHLRTFIFKCLKWFVPLAHNVSRLVACRININTNISLRDVCLKPNKMEINGTLFLAVKILK